MLGATLVPGWGEEKVRGHFSTARGLDRPRKSPWLPHLRASLKNPLGPMSFQTQSALPRPFF
jgi:hypothetical protein